MAKIIHLETILSHTPGYPLSFSSDVFRFAPRCQPLSQTDVPTPLRTSLDMDTLEAIFDRGDSSEFPVQLQGFRSATPSDPLTPVRVCYERFIIPPGRLNSSDSSPPRVK